ncbi:MAG: EFR1 family ferrodoxin [Bacilli bacterium]|nr:EFR1 family ferrodoxin [Bacilli bacterium]
MENKKCLLIYYSGTGNTKYVTNNLENKLIEANFDVEVYRINPSKLEILEFSKYDIIGVGYPIYGFNMPGVVHKFFKKQKFNKGQQVFVYKNSGETYGANDSSSLALRRILKRQKANFTNEYHFVMPYNIHFRFDENLVKEMLEMDEKLMQILVYELVNGIQNVKKYKFINNLINYPLRLTYIGGNINVLFYRVKKDKCTKCGLCVKGCQKNNIYFDKNGNAKFHSHCMMCMNCTLNCPKDAIRMGLFDSWRVNKPYNLKAIEQIELKEPIITKDTKGFFKCYIKTFEDIKRRYNEIFEQK